MEVCFCYLLLFFYSFINKVSDVHPCDVDNGGCDYRVECIRQEEERICGECPQGTNGTGDTGCTSKLIIVLFGIFLFLLI